MVLIFPTFYAMTGGLILQWLLGYNFSVAVWVGYIAAVRHRGGDGRRDGRIPPRITRQAHSVGSPTHRRGYPRGGH